MHTILLRIWMGRDLKCTYHSSWWKICPLKTEAQHDSDPSGLTVASPLHSSCGRMVAQQHTPLHSSWTMRSNSPTSCLTRQVLLLPLASAGSCLSQGTQLKGLSYYSMLLKPLIPPVLLLPSAVTQWQAAPPSCAQRALAEPRQPASGFSHPWDSPGTR